MSSGPPSSLSASSRASWKRWILLLGIAGVAGVGGWWSTWQRPKLGAAVTTHTPSSEASRAISLVGPDTLSVPEATVRAMQLSVRLARAASAPSVLKLSGRLMLDPNELVHVNSRFPGEVIKVGMLPDRNRQLRAGDTVKAGQLLAIIWSKEIGEKKSDLVDALSQLALHEAIYKTLKDPGISDAVPRRSVEEGRRNYESDLIEVERLRRTLRSWRLSEEELAEIEREALRFHKWVMRPTGKEDPEHPNHRIDETWAEIDIRSPLDGVILEKNLTVGDIIRTDQDHDLFKVADLSRLVVAANVYEEDIPTLTALPEDQRVWQVRLTTNPQAPVVTGPIESIGKVIDPNQHTAIVQGWIDNSHGELRVGQFVEALVSLAAQPGLTEIPLTGLIDDGPKKFVIVALDDSLTRLERREVAVISRTKDAVLVRREGPLAIQDGDRILVRGVLELSSTLDRLRPVPESQ